jgi:hypothetical protein
LRGLRAASGVAQGVFLQMTAKLVRNVQVLLKYGIALQLQKSYTQI